MKLPRSGWVALFLTIAWLCAVCVPFTLAYVTASTSLYVNSFMPDPLAMKDGTVYIRIEKAVSNLGKATIGPEGFQFELINTQTQQRMTTATNDAGQACFQLQFTIADAGVHRYQLREIDDHRPGVTYSPLQYDVEIHVQGRGEELEVQSLLNGQQVQTCLARFENIYDSGSIPETGDRGLVWLYVVLLFASGSCLMLLNRKKRKNAG